MPEYKIEEKSLDPSFCLDKDTLILQKEQSCVVPELVCHWFTRDHPPCNSLSQPITTSAPNSLNSSE